MRHNCGKGRLKRAIEKEVADFSLNCRLFSWNITLYYPWLYMVGCVQLSRQHTWQCLAAALERGTVYLAASLANEEAYALVFGRTEASGAE